MLARMLFAWVLGSALVTAAISGSLGMAGGMILMGIYASLLPVAAAMVLHGITQLASNGSRAWLWRQHVDRRVLGGYLLGALGVLLLFALLSVRVERWLLFLTLGAVPLVARALPERLSLHVETRAMAALCGVVVTACQLVAGVSGPLLDVFFLRGTLDRRQVVATKALTQTLGHTLKLIYFGGILPATSDAVELTLPLWIYPAVVACAVLGTGLGRIVLERLSEEQFRRASAQIVTVIGVFYVARGIVELSGWSAP